MCCQGSAATRIQAGTHIWPRIAPSPMCSHLPPAATEQHLARKPKAWGEGFDGQCSWRFSLMPQSREERKQRSLPSHPASTQIGIPSFLPASCRAAPAWGSRKNCEHSSLRGPNQPGGDDNFRQQERGAAGPGGGGQRSTRGLFSSSHRLPARFGANLTASRSLLPQGCSQDISLALPHSEGRICPRCGTFPLQ